jgi:aminoglycoside phosphotransferase family enzyme/predicted kinase
LIDALLDPAVYSWHPEQVTHLETHVSQLFFAGERVVKIKRAVDYGFVNHLTLSSRHQSCLDEVRLNRLLSDGVYLACEPVVDAGDGKLRLGGEGEPVEWATLMRLLPAEAMLDVLIERGQLPPDIGEALAGRLIPFHQRAGNCPGDAAEQAADAERILRENLDEIAPFSGAPVFPVEFGLIAESVRGFLNRHPGALGERAAQGWIREGHGDLRCEHICLDPPGSVQVFDCVEFSQSIRCADIASDLAFLLLDLERLGEEKLATELVDRYRAAGIDLPDDMLALYRTHRALVRAKVSTLTWSSATGDPQTEALALMVDWLHRAAASVLRTAPVIVAMTGLSGTGKSVVASAIGVVLNASVISTDELRKQSIPDAADRYDPARRLEIYERLIEQARTELARNRPVVLDGTFLNDEQRLLASHLATETGASLGFVEVVADSDVTERRIIARAAETGSANASEATIDVLRAQRQEVEQHPVSLPANAAHLTIDTTSDGPVSLDPLFDWLNARGLIRSRLP